ncbi:sulfurtransferase [Domibacillus aminovorans]|uniref:sulfurtransferase n=1 Tax=Domibacillus aminovorans TaxID=29332 RepID=UPI003D22DECA
MKDNITVLDIRDYHESQKGSHKAYLNIPFAYLKRNYREIRYKQVHVIATDQLELNLALRYLKARGFKVTSYSLKNRQSNTKQKGDICYDVR